MSQYYGIRRCVWECIASIYCFDIYFLQINPVLQYCFFWHKTYNILNIRIINKLFRSVHSNQFDIRMLYFNGGSVTHIKELKSKEKYSNLNSEDQSLRAGIYGCRGSTLWRSLKVKRSILNWIHDETGNHCRVIWTEMCTFKKSSCFGKSFVIWQRF